MKRKFEQLLALSLYEWRLMASAMLMLPVVDLLLWRIGFKRTQRLLNRSITAGKERDVDTAADIEKARVIARMIAVSARHGPYRTGCLRQSLLVQWMLVRQAIPSEIRFGIENRPIESFSAHAWVECGGVNISDEQGCQRRFRAFEVNRDTADDSITMHKS